MGFARKMGAVLQTFKEHFRVGFCDEMQELRQERPEVAPERGAVDRYHANLAQARIFEEAAALWASGEAQCPSFSGFDFEAFERLAADAATINRAGKVLTHERGRRRYETRN